MFTAVYGSPQRQKCCYLLDHLNQLSKTIDGLWLFAGEFNVIMNSSYRKGGATRGSKGYTLFSHFMSNNSLFQVEYVGPNFTWRIGTIFQTSRHSHC